MTLIIAKKDWNYFKSVFDKNSGTYGANIAIQYFGQLFEGLENAKEYLKNPNDDLYYEPYVSAILNDEFRIKPKHDKLLLELENNGILEGKDVAKFDKLVNKLIKDITKFGKENKIEKIAASIDIFRAILGMAPILRK